MEFYVVCERDEPEILDELDFYFSIFLCSMPTYKTLEGARAGAESEFNSPEKYDIYKITMERV